MKTQPKHRDAWFKRPEQRVCSYCTSLLVETSSLRPPDFQRSVDPPCLSLWVLNWSKWVMQDQDVTQIPPPSQKPSASASPNITPPFSVSLSLSPSPLSLSICFILSISPLSLYLSIYSLCLSLSPPSLSLFIHLPFLSLFLCIIHPSLSVSLSLYLSLSPLSSLCLMFD